MALRPSSYLDWTDGNISKVTQPPAPQLLQGWTAGEAPAFQYMNWLFWLTDQWIKYLDQTSESGGSDETMRLIDGGTWSFDATTGDLTWSDAAHIAIPSIPDASNELPADTATLADGQILYAEVNRPYHSTGDTNSGVNEIVNMNFTGNITVGMNVTGNGIPGGTTVTFVDTDSVTISNNATATQTGADFTFSEDGPLTAVVGDNDTTILSVDQILLARRSGNTIYLGINASQMVLRDGEFKTLIGSGYFSLYQAVAGENLVTGDVVYLSEGDPPDTGRTAQRLYKLDVSQDWSQIRGIFAGVIITDVTSGNSADVLYSGFFEETGLTPGKVYYADPANPGAITDVRPSGAGEKIVPVGFAVTSTSLLVNNSEGVGSFTGPFPVFYDEVAGFGNGSDVNFTLSQEPLSEDAIFVFLDGLVVPESEWSLTGIDTVTFTTAPGVGQQVYVQYLLADQGYLTALQEVPTTVSSTVFEISGTPLSQEATFVWIDGVLLPASEWTLAFGGGGATITLDTALAPGQSIYVGYFVPANNPPAPSVANLGGGFGIYFQTLSGVIQLKSLIAGTNVTIAANDDEITISASGGAGSAWETHGDISTPIAIDPTVGIVPTTAEQQVWFVEPTTSGASPITASPQIAAGVSVGQVLKLKGVSSTDYLVIADGSGVSQNGSCNLTDNQTISYTWNGSEWDEDSRRM